MYRECAPRIIPFCAHARGGPTRLSAAAPEHAASSAAPYSLCFIPTREALQDHEVRSAWFSLASHSDNPDSLFQSPAWSESWLGTRDDRSHEVAILRNSHGGILGVVPMRFESASLAFTVGHRTLHRRTWRVANMLGSQPLIPNDPDAHATLYEATLRRTDCCSGLLIRSLPIGSFTWDALHAYAARDWLAHPLDGVHKRRHIHIPPALDAFLSPLHRKHRRLIRQKLAAFDESVNSGSRLVRVDSPHQVRMLLRLVAQVSQQSWQHRALGPRIVTAHPEQQRLQRLAARGVLRSYLLLFREEPCAFVIGYQHADVFHYVEVGFDQKYARLSPGTVLLLLILRDLARHRPARWLNFGTGDAGYKARFSTHATDSASLIVIPSTLANRMLTAAQAAFVGARDGMRGLLRGMKGV